MIEKKNETPRPIKLTESVNEQVNKYLLAHDVCFSVWVNSLITKALSESEAEYQRLKTIFGQSDE